MAYILIQITTPDSITQDNGVAKAEDAHVGVQKIINLLEKGEAGVKDLVIDIATTPTQTTPSAGAGGLATQFKLK